MAGKRKKVDEISVNEEDDTCFFEDGENINSSGDLVTSFSFDGAKTETPPKAEPKENQNQQKIIASSEKLYDNRNDSYANGMIPPIEGEAFNVMRTYKLRASTVRKIHELKSAHAEINICVSQIVDECINYYYDCFFNKN